MVLGEGERGARTCPDVTLALSFDAASLVPRPREAARGGAVGELSRKLTAILHRCIAVLTALWRREYSASVRWVTGVAGPVEVVRQGDPKRPLSRVPPKRSMRHSAKLREQSAPRSRSAPHRPSAGNRPSLLNRSHDASCGCPSGSVSGVWSPAAREGGVRGGCGAVQGEPPP